MRRSELRRRSRLRPQSRKQARRDRRFAAARLLVLERDGYRCRLCGMASTLLQVHHLLMRSQGGSDLSTTIRGGATSTAG